MCPLKRGCGKEFAQVMRVRRSSHAPSSSVCYLIVFVRVMAVAISAEMWDVEVLEQPPFPFGASPTMHAQVKVMHLAI
eukprot:6479639-Amphidinium_carterae.1